MYSLSNNTRLIVGSISSVVAIGLGYWIFKNYPKYVSCGHHCSKHCSHTNTETKTEINDDDNNDDNNNANNNTDGNN